MVQDVYAGLWVEKLDRYFDVPHRGKYSVALHPSCYPVPYNSKWFIQLKYFPLTYLFNKYLLNVALQKTLKS